MSMHPQPIGPVPDDTARVARAAFPKGTTYIHMRDVLGAIYDDEDFAPLFEVRGRPAIAPWRLALVTLMQFSEGLSDRQAAEAVRARIDWKYVLGLQLGDPGFDFSVLSEFRARLVEGESEHLLLESLLAACKERGYLKARGRQRTDSTHVLGALRVLSRLELAAETMRAALNASAAAAPEWVGEHADPEWFERYSRRIEEHRLPKGKQARMEYLKTVGADGMRLLARIDDDPRASESLKGLAEVEVLRGVSGSNTTPRAKKGCSGCSTQKRYLKPPAAPNLPTRRRPVTPPRRTVRVGSATRCTLRRAATRRIRRTSSRTCENHRGHRHGCKAASVHLGRATKKRAFARRALSGRRLRQWEQPGL